MWECVVGLVLRIDWDGIGIGIGICGFKQKRKAELMFIYIALAGIMQQLSTYEILATLSED